MMWFLLLACPVAVLVLGLAARSGAVTSTDTACAVLDLRLDRQAALIRDGAAAGPFGVPAPRTSTPAAPRHLASVGSELLAG